MHLVPLQAPSPKKRISTGRLRSTCAVLFSAILLLASCQEDAISELVPADTMLLLGTRDLLDLDESLEALFNDLGLSAFFDQEAPSLASALAELFLVDREEFFAAVAKDRPMFMTISGEIATNPSLLLLFPVANKAKFDALLQAPGQVPSLSFQGDYAILQILGPKVSYPLESHLDLSALAAAPKTGFEVIVNMQAFTKLFGDLIPSTVPENLVSSILEQFAPELISATLNYRDEILELHSISSYSEGNSVLEILQNLKPLSSPKFLEQLDAREEYGFVASSAFKPGFAPEKHVGRLLAAFLAAFDYPTEHNANFAAFMDLLARSFDNMGDSFLMRSFANAAGQSVFLTTDQYSIRVEGVYNLVDADLDAQLLEATVASFMLLFDSFLEQALGITEPSIAKLITYTAARSAQGVPYQEWTVPNALTATDTVAKSDGSSTLFLVTHDEQTGYYSSGPRALETALALREDSGPGVALSSLPNYETLVSRLANNPIFLSHVNPMPFLQSLGFNTSTVVARQPLGIISASYVHSNTQVSTVAMHKSDLTPLVLVLFILFESAM